jgi:hypothetical protein
VTFAKIKRSTANRLLETIRAKADKRKPAGPAPAAIVELARLALKAKNETARIAAIRELLDRGYGRTRQAWKSQRRTVILSSYCLRRLMPCRGGPIVISSTPKNPPEARICGSLLSPRPSSPINSWPPGRALPAAGSSAGRQHDMIGAARFHWVEWPEVFAVARSDLWDIPLLLDLMGHLDDEEAKAIYARTSRHPEHVIRRHVLRVYFKFCNRSKRLN